ncbi:putative ech hydrogenase subunit B [Thermacetogenium phaeum DSM 12270]|uniref:Putative ech hydrogenase subunit B n=1 Tax=Thermacetogenium phaeum (strain ATCC BAA-254 / DSM 26808 / PB) TaxID=1089553 RepID=K4LWG1_THEPS|nr:complex I subunit 1 family protein [Thermacetogenium phaeum]AFV12329.1 putative ech hydrogenase subunit B [Thermacetogenium phaeum DSM 12270]
MNQVWIAIVAIIVAPLIGGLLAGIDRKITARLQGRYGPPLIQPFYDFFKLLGKTRIATSRTQFIWLYGYLIFMIAALVMLVLKQDLLLLVFLLGFAGISFVLAGFSCKSPYSHFGANRELLQILAYEPVLLLMALGVFATNGSFMISEIFESSTPLLAKLWPIFIALLVVLTIKMRKSPFDISTSHHGHQELVKGIMTEISGPYYALVTLTEWYELVLVLGLIALFWANPLWVEILIALAAFVLELIIDNINARMTAGWMVRFTWAVGLVLCILNIAYLYFMKGVS